MCLLELDGMKDSRWYCCHVESGGADSSSVAAIVGAMCTVSQSNEPFAGLLILYSSYKVMFVYIDCHECCTKGSRR